MSEWDNDSGTTASFYEENSNTLVSPCEFNEKDDSDNDTVVSLYEFNEEDKRNNTHISVVSFMIIILALILYYLY